MRIPFWIFDITTKSLDVHSLMLKQTIRTETLPLVALELGSYSVRAIAAERIADDKFRILGLEESQKHPSVDQANVIQSENTAYMISEVLNKLANRIGVPNLPTAFVPIGGYPTKMAAVQAKRDNVHIARVTKALLQSMEDECYEKIRDSYPDLEVLGLVPAYFLLDGKEHYWDDVRSETELATLVEGHYTAFITKKIWVEKFDKCFNQAMRSIEQSFVRVDALLSVFAAEDGDAILQEGCAVLDFGAKTTTLTVYKGSEYLYHRVVAQGGYHISTLLAQQGIRFEHAEKVKKDYGFASRAQVKENKRLRIPSVAPEIGEYWVASFNEIADLIDSKLQEILQPLLETIATYGDRIHTIYITGGGSMLQGLDAYVEEKTGLRVMYGLHDVLLSEDTEDIFYEPRFTSLMGALLLGAYHRDTHKGELVKSPKLVDKIKAGMIDIFSNEQM